MSTEQKQRLIADRVKRGHRADESEALLDDLLRHHDGDNLDAALQYQGFTR